MYMEFILDLSVNWIEFSKNFIEKAKAEFLINIWLLFDGVVDIVEKTRQEMLISYIASQVKEAEEQLKVE